LFFQGGKARVVVVKQVTKSNPLKGDIIEPEEEQEVGASFLSKIILYHMFSNL
jgi:hypothetical protein